MPEHRTPTGLTPQWTRAWNEAEWWNRRLSAFGFGGPPLRRRKKR